MAINKVIFGDTTLIDTSEVTVTPNTMIAGTTALDATGETITGTLGIESLNVIKNGTYNAPTGKAYNSIEVNVSDPSNAILVTKNIVSNGTYNASDDNADGYSSVTVNYNWGHWCNNSLRIININGIIIENKNLANGIANLSGYEYSSGFEGMNIVIVDLEKNKNYTLSFDFQTISGGFFTGQYTFGFKISDRTVSSYPTSPTPDSSYTAFPRDFTKQSYSTTFTASASEMYLIVAFVGYQDSGQNVFEMTNMTITENIET